MEEALRAAKLSRIPGVTIAEARERFDVTASAIKKARNDPRSQPTLAELALAALTRNGTVRTGSFDDLASIAGWLDYVNHDGSTEADVRKLLAECASAGLLSIERSAWRLLGDWP
jgi:hypothetical protein